MTDISHIRRIGLVGGGVIGAGWAARFALAGYDVCLFDPDPAIDRNVETVLSNARRAQQRLLGALLPDEGTVTLAKTLAEAVAHADFIQESLPEIETLKQRVLCEIEAAARPEVVIGSSTSGLLPTRLQSVMMHPERLVVGHPFNPVYLLPLVEVCGGQATTQVTKDVATTLYTTCGMQALQVRVEIDGFIADRLLEALWREALWLVNDGVATTTEIDDAIRYGAGLRWSFMGTFLTYRLAGGEAGMRHFLAQFGPALKLPWTKLVACELTDDLTDRIAAQSDEQAGGIGLRAYEQKRDDCLVDVMTALKANDFASGATLKAYAERLAARQAAPQSGAAVTTNVDAAWIDYNGHMTEWAYLKLFGDATDVLLAQIGAGPDYVAAGHSFYTVESHLRHLGQARLGARIAVATHVLGADTKRLHIFHTMTGGDDTVIATAEHMLVHVDTATERSTEIVPAVAGVIAVRVANDAALARPAAAGRGIALPTG